MKLTKIPKTFEIMEEERNCNTHVSFTIAINSRNNVRHTKNLFRLTLLRVSTSETDRNK